MLALALLGALLISACGGTPVIEEDPAPRKVDQTQATIEAYLRGDVKAPATVALHNDAAVGHYWELATTVSGITTITRWQVSAVTATGAVVEYQTRVEGPEVQSNYVIAMAVDTAKAAGQPNVTGAWIGRPGEIGQEIQVGSAMAAVGSTTQEPFEGVSLAGGSWHGTLHTTATDNGDVKVWRAANGWFDGTIKIEAGENVTELSSFGTNAAPLLLWD